MKETPQPPNNTIGVFNDCKCCTFSFCVVPSGNANFDKFSAQELALRSQKRKCDDQDEVLTSSPKKKALKPNPTERFGPIPGVGKDPVEHTFAISHQKKHESLVDCLRRMSITIQSQNQPLKDNPKPIDVQGLKLRAKILDRREKLHAVAQFLPKFLAENKEWTKEWLLYFTVKFIAPRLEMTTESAREALITELSNLPHLEHPVHHDFVSKI